MNIKVNINEKWNWSNVGLSTLAGFAIGGSFGALNGLIMEERYQRQLDKGRTLLRNSDVAEALGERAGDVAANLEATAMWDIWRYGHNYANLTSSISGSICIGIQTGRCTIIIDPFAPMIPNLPTYYVP